MPLRQHPERRRHAAGRYESDKLARKIGPCLLHSCDCLGWELRIHAGNKCTADEFDDISRHFRLKRERELPVAKCIGSRHMAVWEDIIIKCEATYRRIRASRLNTLPLETSAWGLPPEG